MYFMVNSKQTQAGFALILSMVMLIAMTLMGTVLVMNASNQSKITGISESNNQTFLSSETGIEAAMRWLDDKADKNTLPDNTAGSLSTMCGYTLDTSGALTMAGTASNIKMTAELGVTSAAERKIYDNQAFYWALRKHSTSSFSGTGVGGSIGQGLSYGRGTGNMTTYLYKIFSCGKGPGTGQTYTRTLVEAIVGLTK